MAVANKLGKEILIITENFPPSSNLYKIFDKHNFKLSYSSMPKVANLINESNAKKLSNKQRIKPPKCNCIDKTTCPLKGNGNMNV